MAITINPKTIANHPDYAHWQELLQSHPDGVPGVPIAVGEFPDRLVLVDCAGHKLVFPTAVQADVYVPPNPPAKKKVTR